MLAHVREGGIELAVGARLHDVDAQPERLRRRLHRLRIAHRRCRVRGIDEEREARCRGHDLVQDLEPFLRQLLVEVEHAVSTEPAPADRPGFRL